MSEMEVSFFIGREKAEILPYVHGGKIICIYLVLQEIRIVVNGVL